MQAAILESVPGELVIDDVQIGAVGPHDVLVRTVAAGLCHSDLHFMEGKYPCPVPTVLGHESAGRRRGGRRAGHVRAARRPRRSRASAASAARARTACRAARTCATRRA